jgi:hypothetical protein
MCARTLALVLNKRASLVREGAEDTAIACLRFQHRVTSLTLMDDYAPVRGHRQRLDVLAHGTHQLGE